MFNNIIKASRLRELPEPNVFIGGDFTKTQVANKIGVSNSEIKVYKIVDNQISFRIDIDYSFIDSAFRNENILYYIDLEGKCIGGNGVDIFLGNNLSIIYLPKILNLPNFSIRSRVNILSIPEINVLGENSLENGVFNQKVNQIIINKTQETINSGSPDGDLITASSLGSTIVYKDLTDPNQTTTPTAPTISANTNIGGTYVELNVSQPTHVNNLKYALVFVNGFFQDVINYTSGALFVADLQEQTNYDIKVIIADEYFNISPYSNTINVTTTTTPALFQNAAAYYKLDETSGDAIDVVNGYNGTLFGGVTQGVSGKIGNAYSFDGVDGRIDLSNSIYNKLTSSDFTFSIWFKTNDVTKTQIIVSDLETISGLQQRKLYCAVVGASQNLRLIFGDNGLTQTIDSTTITNNTWYFLQIKHNSSGVQEMKLNNVSQGTHTYVSAPTLEQKISIGNQTVNNDFPFDGELDEVSFINGQTTNATDTAIYNANNGTTI